MVGSALAGETAGCAATAGKVGGSSAAAEGAAATGITGVSSAVTGTGCGGRTVVYRGSREACLVEGSDGVEDGLGAKGKTFSSKVTWREI